MPPIYNFAIIGGGFSGLATLANIVRDAQKNLSIAVISRDKRGVFGPAYSTPRPEHLLNVPAGNMGVFSDNPGHFHAWLVAQGETAGPGEYLPRATYGRYLQSVLDETLALARDKGIRVDWFEGEVDAVEDHAEYIAIRSGDEFLAALSVVLAVGNALKGRAETGPITERPWQFDFSSLSPAQKNIALIGSGLTAADVIISILDSGWQGNIHCYSGSAALPQSHLIPYDASQRQAPEPGGILSQRLSQVLRAMRAHIRASGRDWRYVVDGLRPLTQDIWRSLSETDRSRLVKKYFTLWNIHRHRYAPQIGERIDNALKTGQLTMIAARVKDAVKESGGIRLALDRPAATSDTVYDIVFRCAGVDYRIDNNPLLKKMVEAGLLKTTSDGYGIRASDNLLAYRDRPCEIYVIGAPLFGALFETTAVPELRAQAKVISSALLADSIASKSLAFD
ncbi:MAG TPA: FAD/NAD(P)-binding protein [Patescibacteria group bacterium]|nr:FAD/NAD(P)-binding protein [Patescibacteria group bacterium]